MKNDHGIVFTATVDGEGDIRLEAFYKYNRIAFSFIFVPSILLNWKIQRWQKKVIKQFAILQAFNNG